MKIAIKFLAITVSIILFASHAWAENENQEPSENPKEETKSIEKLAEEKELDRDDPIVAMLDSLALMTIFQNIEKRTPKTENHFPAGFVPEYTDSIYAARIARLNDNSPFEFVYNASVRSYINLYAFRRRELTERVMGLGKLYFPLFEEQLDKHDIPLELKYIAVIESALNPVARSRVGATGLWQFMYGTGKMYGLNVNSLVDDRSDIVKSTIAACEHFVDLYNIYNDWNLVLAAYNAGPGNVNRAIRRAGGVRDFWAIRRYMPRETQNYVPGFIAVAYVIEHAEDHNLFPMPPLYTDLDVDTFQVREQLSLRVVSQFTDIPLNHLRYLNPSFRQNIIPNSPDKPNVLRIPREYSAIFMANEDTIYNHRTPEQIRQEELAAQMQETTVHVVRSGEVLGTIARRYGTSVREIQRLNNMRSTLIRPGQRLIVRAPARPATNIASNPNTHVVRRGESLGVIASRYRVSVADLRNWNNISGSTIYAGQNLIVRQPQNFEAAEQKKEDKEKDQTAEDISLDQEDDSDSHTDYEYDDSYEYYTIQSGDTLKDIAARFEGITTHELMDWNEISSDEDLQPGKKIIISIAD